MKLKAVQPATSADGNPDRGLRELPGDEGGGAEQEKLTRGDREVAGGALAVQLLQDRVGHDLGQPVPELLRGLRPVVLSSRGGVLVRASRLGVRVGAHVDRGRVGSPKRPRRHSDRSGRSRGPGAVLPPEKKKAPANRGLERSAPGSSPRSLAATRLGMTRSALAASELLLLFHRGDRDGLAGRVGRALHGDLLVRPSWPRPPGPRGPRRSCRPRCREPTWRPCP